MCCVGCNSSSVVLLSRCSSTVAIPLLVGPVGPRSESRPKSRPTPHLARQKTRLVCCRSSESIPAQRYAVLTLPPYWLIPIELIVDLHELVNEKWAATTATHFSLSCIRGRRYSTPSN